MGKAVAIAGLASRLRALALEGGSTGVARFEFEQIVDSVIDCVGRSLPKAMELRSSRT